MASNSRSNNHPNIDNALNSINCFITLPQFERQSYAEDFTFIRDTLMKKLCESDEIFKKLYHGTCLAGSYADKLKISKPNEYDVLIQLKLVENSKIIIIPDTNNPGYVKINISDAMSKIRKEKQHKNTYDRFEDLVDSNRYIIQDEIQRWFKSTITKLLNKCDCKIHNKNKIYTIKYSINGPAHTFKINEPEFSIDFVPAFIFEKSQWISRRLPYPNIDTDDLKWFAIPKPFKNQNQIDNNSTNLCFITSYNKTERILIKGKDNLKNTLKMLKKLRDGLNITNMKSYYIKTIYLWENENQSKEFWKRSTSSVFFHMFEKLLNCLENHELLFFWDDQQNMLRDLHQNQIKSMLGQFKKAYDKLRKIPTCNENIYDIFLLPEERMKILLKENCNLNHDSIDDSFSEFSSKMQLNDDNSKSDNNKSDAKVKNHKINNDTHASRSSITTSAPAVAGKQQFSSRVLIEIQNILTQTNTPEHEKITKILDECKKYEVRNIAQNVKSFWDLLFK